MIEGQTVKITGGHDPHSVRVTTENGQDISRYVTYVTYDARPGYSPAVKLELVACVDVEGRVVDAFFPDVVSSNVIVVRGQPMSLDVMDGLQLRLDAYRTELGVTAPLLLLWLGDGASLSAVSEREMNAAGWYLAACPYAGQPDDDVSQVTVGVRTPAERAYDETYGRI